MSVVLFVACNGCGNTQKNVVLVDSIKDTTIVIDVDHAIAVDRQTMYLKFGDDYRWYETQVHLNEFLNSENVTSNPEYVINIFQSIVEKGNGYDTKVWKFKHYSDTTIRDSLDGFWIEDMALNDEAIKFNYKAAFACSTTSLAAFLAQMSFLMFF